MAFDRIAPSRALHDLFNRCHDRQHTERLASSLCRDGLYRVPGRPSTIEGDQIGEGYTLEPSSGVQRR